MAQKSPHNVVQIGDYTRSQKGVTGGTAEQIVADRQIAQPMGADYADDAIAADSVAPSEPLDAPESASIREEEDPGMTDGVTRYELDAKLETIETRMDRRLDRMEELVKSSIVESKEMRFEAKQEAKETKRHVDLVVLAGVGVMVAVVAIAIGITNSWLQTYLTHIAALVAHHP